MTEESNNVSKWNKIYQEQNPDEIPWNFEVIPDCFKRVIDSGWVKSCKTLDMGCGLGHYANYLVSLGFNVLAIDFSEQAVRLANDKYSNPNLSFKVLDALEISSLNEKFDFVYEVSLFHHIAPRERKDYAEQIHAVTNPGSKVMICCFSETEKFFAGQKVFDNPETSTIMYPLSEKEIRDVFGKLFNIEKIEKINFGKSSDRERFLVLMSKVR